MDENENKKSVEVDMVRLNLEREWKDVKYADDRGNQVADKMITTEIQAAAIFITLIGVLLSSEEGKAEPLLLVVGIFIFSLSIMLGIFGFYMKERFWIVEARKHNLVSREWMEVYIGKSTTEHASKMQQYIRAGAMGNRSSAWPMILQTSLFILALVVSFIGLAKIVVYPGV